MSHALNLLSVNSFDIFNFKSPENKVDSSTKIDKDVKLNKSYFYNENVFSFFKS